MNVAARLSTSDKNKGILYHSTYIDRVQALPTSQSNDPLHPRFCSEVEIRGKPHDPVFNCRECEDNNLVLSQFNSDILSQLNDFSPAMINGIAIAYDLPKYSQGDRSELSKRFRSVIDSIKSIKTRLIFPIDRFFFSPGGDGGILVLSLEQELSIQEYINIAFELIETLEIESDSRHSNIDVKSRVGIHYGIIILYPNAENILIPTGLNCFIADEIASDELARNKGGIIITEAIKDLLYKGNTKRLLQAYEPLTYLAKGAAKTIKRYAKKLDSRAPLNSHLEESKIDKEEVKELDNNSFKSLQQKNDLTLISDSNSSQQIWRNCQKQATLKSDWMTFISTNSETNNSRRITSFPPRYEIVKNELVYMQINLGTNTRILIDDDWEIINKHLSQESNAELIKLQEPTLYELGNFIEQYCPQILFFAGHSYSDKNLTQGSIKLNRDEYITIEDLKYELIKAAKKGLKLAIFNSCDGMGIGRQLQDIGISNIIAMREPLPDEVAHIFLTRFLERFACGKSINLAVRRGRERLQSLEQKYPGVACLPVIWQNPAEPPLTWEQLGGKVTINNTNDQNSILWVSTVIQKNNTSENLSKTEHISDSQLIPNTLEVSTEIYTEVFTEIQKPCTSDSSSKTEKAYVNQNISNELKYPIPTILRQRYKIVKPIGEGGFGNTYLAIDLDIPNHPACVVKHLLPKFFDPQTNSNVLETAKRLFKTEAEVLSRLGEHECIPRLYAYFEENGQFYLVQEFILGENLNLEFQSGKKWTEENTINFLQKLLKILAFVHKNDTIHRDIKPSNIMRRESDGKLVLIDFGAVKEALTLDQNRQSAFTVAIGTPFYMPPEQMMGRPGKYSDVYAVGILGIQAFTGLSYAELVFTTERLQQVLDELKINPKLKYVLNRMVSFDYNNRFPDAIEALEAINSINIKPVNTSTRKIKLTKKSLLVLFGTIATIIIVAGVYVLVKT
jgi:serine/threonine-protein kinase